MREWMSVFDTVDPASRRVFLRFLYTLPTQVAKHITELTLRKGWRDIFVYPLDQRGMFEVVPAYSKLSDSQKEEMDARIPDIIAECIAEEKATASDALIFKHVGHIIGPPRRGLPGDTDAAEPPRVVDLDEGDEEYEDETEQPARKKVPSGRKRAVKPLEEMFFNRWRAAIFTPETYRKALADRVQRERDKAHEKTMKTQAAAEEKTKKAEEAAAKKKARTAANQLRDEEKALGPRVKVARSKEAVDECFQCLASYVAPPDGQDSLWTGCEHCDGRWVCNLPDCVAALSEHEVKCKQRRLEKERAHQEVVQAAPRQRR